MSFQSHRIEISNKSHLLEVYLYRENQQAGKITWNNFRHLQHIASIWDDGASMGDIIALATGYGIAV